MLPGKFVTFYLLGFFQLWWSITLKVVTRLITIFSQNEGDRDQSQVSTLASCPHVTSAFPASDLQPLPVILLVRVTLATTVVVSVGKSRPHGVALHCSRGGNDPP